MDGDREAVLSKYREYLLSRPDLLTDLHELDGEVLGCWCCPERCHGDVLLELPEKHNSPATEQGFLLRRYFQSHGLRVGVTPEILIVHGP